jgi:hypothetical protein
VSGPFLLRLVQGRDDVEVQGLAGRAGLLRAIQHGQGAHAPRQRGHQIPSGERAEEPHLHETDPLAAGIHPLHGLVSRLGSRPHHDEHAFRLRVAHVVEQAIGPACQRGEAVHRVLNQPGTVEVVGVGRFPRLEEGVGVLRGAPQNGMVRVQGPIPVAADEVVVEQRAEIVVGQLLDLGHFVRRPEAVEEVEERDPAAQRGGVGDGGHVVGLLHGARGQHGEARGPAGHHVGVIPEDGQGMRRHGPRGHVHAERRQLPGDLVHVGDHQQQALGRREGGGQAAGLQRAVDGPRRSGLRLHLDDLGHGSPHVGPGADRPGVGQLSHGRGRRDRIDGDDLAGAMRHGDRGLVPVDGDAASWVIGHRPLL